MADLNNNDLIAGIPKEELFSPGHGACLGCGEAIAIRHVLKAAGKNTVVVQATGCPEVYSTPFPLTSWKVPYIHTAFENAAAVASGIREGLNIQGKNDVNVIAFGGDGATYDIGLQSLSGALERGHKFLYICLNNEAYENTGVQRSGATEKYAWTTTTPIGSKIIGKSQYRKPLSKIIAAHNIPYVATASLHNLPDLYRKIKFALNVNGPSYIEILCPCIPGWKMTADMSYDLALLAFKSNVWPLYEIITGKLILTKNESPISLEEYFKLQGRYSHLLKPENKKLLDELKEHVYKQYKDLEIQNSTS
ncbi:MAG: thiamine pyrophosphate-dependent enzyme [Candidatus Pacearchaeota archaeon]|jgi:pyruvate ferredoxin oxidoreductase beta subunit